MKSILITGAGRRLGLFLTKHFLRKKWHVIAHYNKTKEHLESLQKQYSSLTILQHDFTQEYSSFENTFKEIGSINVLINNASSFVFDNISSATLNSWEENLDVNLKAPFFISQLFFKTQKKGCIVNILDQRVWNITPYFTTYTLAKCGMWALTQQMALSMAPFVRVNAIGPGFTLPAEHQSLEDFQRQYAQVPLKISTPLEDIAKALNFIISAQSLTGQMIALDGGQHLGWSFPSTHEPEEG